MSIAFKIIHFDFEKDSMWYSLLFDLFRGMEARANIGLPLSTGLKMKD